MTPERLKQISRLYESAAGMPAAQRQGFLRRKCGEDDALVAEVLALLDADAEPDRSTAAPEQTIDGIASSEELHRRPPGTLLGRQLGEYVVESLLGSGGMGSVYRARDTRLKRDVAIKIIPDEFTRDSERVERFHREAEILASLNHPHIAAIYDVARSDELPYIVMEFVKGETLAAKIARGALSVADSLRIGEQIAAALEAAHDRGIVHRDLKPANVLITPEGDVKVLDLGLAKMADPEGSVRGAPTALTLSTPGMIVGTPAYMSPEQAVGEATGPKTDIWAFGCILFEMLSGRAAFGGDTVGGTLARVIEAKPDLDLLPPEIPYLLRRLVDRCLVKDARLRLRHIGDARDDIRDAQAMPQVEASPASVPVSRRRFVWGGAAVLAFIVSVAAWLGTRGPTPARSDVVRFEIGDTRPSSPVAVDGRRLAYITASAGVAVRSLDRLAPTLLENLDSMSSPSFSGDGEWLAFAADPAGILSKVPAGGGPAERLIEQAFNPTLGTSWVGNDTVVFASGQGLMRVSAGGGEPELLVAPDPSKGELFLAAPASLQDGPWILYTILPQETSQGNQIAALNLETRESRVLFRGGAAPKFVEPGYLVYVGNETLEARTFDPEQIEAGSEAEAFDIRVMASPPYNLPVYDVSSGGTLAYVPAPVAPGSRTLAWVDREGREEAVPMEARSIAYPRIQPGGANVALDVTEPNRRDVSILDLLRPASLSRFTASPLADALPVWSPDGQSLFFGSQTGGVYNLYRQPADGSRAAERLFENPTTQFPGAVTPDGSQLIVISTTATGVGIGVLTLEEPRTYTTLLEGDFNQGNPDLSPDGRWLAYQSNESGPHEVYVRPFPEVGGRRWQISAGGGGHPQWGPDGQELFFRDASGDMMSVPVVLGPEFSHGEPSRLFPNRGYAFAIGAGISYDVADNGRFLFVKGAEAAPPGIIEVVNWRQELRERLRR